MKNVTTKVEGTKLTITIDLAQRNGPSASGKTNIVATTEGNVSVDGFPEIKLGLNCYTPVAAAPAAK